VRLLLDTNVLLWWLFTPGRLGARAHEAVAAPTNDVYVSAVTGWEIALKVALGKLRVPADVRRWLPSALVESRFTGLPIGMEHALAVGGLPEHHRDPFDRLLIAQAEIEELTIVTGDRQLAAYDVPLLGCW
jgi:PIN domain nuclease of toxin-antitoxin system